MRQFFIFFSFFATLSNSHSHGTCLHTIQKWDDLKREEAPKTTEPIDLASLKNSYSLKLRSSLKEEVKNTALLSNKEKQKFLKELDQTISYLESKGLSVEAGNRRSARLKVLEPLLFKSLEAAPSIHRFLKESESPYLNKKQALEIILITLTKYVRVYLNHPAKEFDIDFKRFEKILSNIAEFNGGAFSVYKIIRSVREKYSLYEYLNCK